MRKIPPRSSKLDDLAMYHDLSEGWYAITNQKKEVGIGILFSKETFRYIWNWQVFGGGEGYPWYGRHYNVGLELCTSLPDGAAFPGSSERTALTLDSGQSIETTIKAIAFESGTGIKKINQDGTIIKN